MDTQPSSPQAYKDRDVARNRSNVRANVVLWSHRILRAATVILAGFGVYHLVLEEIDRDGRLLWGYLLLWVLGAYVLLPRVTRLLTRIYVPDYFIGRARTVDGLLGDPVNLAVRGTPEQLAAALTSAGWTAADPVTLRSGWRIVTASVLRRSYPAAPVSPLFLFGRKQSLAFELEVAGSPAQRHHVRFWTCPPGWKLPGGIDVDILGAATFDRRVGLSLFTLQITHKIAERTDRERDGVVEALRSTGATVEVMRHFTTGYHSRNGGGDAIETDGDLPIIELPSRVRISSSVGEALVRPAPEGTPEVEIEESLDQRQLRLSEARMTPKRTMGFSDAVFSIAMTLLVLDLMIPAGLPDDRAGPALAEAAPQFVAYALSFIVIGRAWMNHHHKFSVIRAFDGRLQWLNLLTLFFVALLPMPTAYLSDYGHTESPWPVVLYAVVTSGVYLSLSLSWRHAWHAGLMDPDVDEAAYRVVLVGARPVSVVFLLSVPLAFWDPGWAMLSWLLLVPLLAIVGRRPMRQPRGQI